MKPTLEDVRRLVGVIHDPGSGASFCERVAAYAGELRRLVPFRRMTAFLIDPAKLRPTAQGLLELPAAARVGGIVRETVFALDQSMDDALDYANHYAPFDVGSTVLLKNPGRVFTLSGAMSVAKARWGADPFTSDYAPRVELRRSAAGAVPVAGDVSLMTSVWRPEARHTFDRAELRVLQVALCELALASQVLLLQARLEAVLLGQLVEGADLRAGALLLSAQGELLDADAGARALAASCLPPAALSAAVAYHARRLGVAHAGETRRAVVPARDGAFVEVTVACTPALPGRVLVLLQRLDAGTQEAVAALASTTGLSARELEVALLAAVGRTNREIAGELEISPATAKLHLERCYRKLGVGGRAELGQRLRPGAAHADGSRP